MTPQQLAAFAQLRHVEREHRLASMGVVTRAAQNADKDGFKKLVDDLTRN